MSNEMTKYKVTLEFEVDINSIKVPDLDAFEKLSAAPGAKKKSPSEAEIRKMMKDKGQSEADIKKYLASAKAKKGGAAKGKPPNYQMLLYPEYESWVAAQQSLLDKILADDDLSNDYIREMVRDLTRGKIEALIAEKYGAPNLNGVLHEAMQRISADEQALLQAAEESQLHDETELVDDAVDYRFSGLTVSRV
ncbi:MAG: hypothetical protein P8J55_05150 [Pseudomonadales bacterium]|nr:hypothetical protein [Pseudomonadales bacterium]